MNQIHEEFNKLGFRDFSRGSELLQRTLQAMTPKTVSELPLPLLACRTTRLVFATESVRQLSKKMADTSYADLARQGIQILNQTVGETLPLTYASRLGDRSIDDVLSQLWKLWVNGEIKLLGDVD